MGKYCVLSIGKEFNSGKLQVVDGGNSIGYVMVKCTECAKDAELFGNAIFETRLSALMEGRTPCGCSKTPRWTLPQYEVRIKRKIKDENLPIKFICFCKDGIALSQTSFSVFCNVTEKIYEINSINTFFAGTGNKGKYYTSDERISQYNLEQHDHIVWDSGKRSRTDVVCGFHCKVCESNGLESLYEVILGNILRNQIPCYCSQKKGITGDDIVELSKRKLHSKNLGGVFVIGAYKKKTHWYTTFICNVHGLYSRRYDQLDVTGCHCLKCSPPVSGYDKTKQGSLYLLEIQTDVEVILGYGITNRLDGRLTTHRTNLNNLGYKILATRVFEGSGTKVLAVENAIKSLHKTGLIDCEGFRRESISIDRKEEVLELCAGLKEKVLDTQ